jgi:hypothetical protein
VIDECGYEGDIFHDWGNLTARELNHRFWTGFTLGGYVGHGETYTHPEDILWWSKGGVLHGQSPARIAFLRKILEEAPSEGLRLQKIRGERRCIGVKDQYYLCYHGERQPRQKLYGLPKTGTYRADIIDTWDMTVTPVAAVCSGETWLNLPAKPYIAVRFIRTE